jgi:hypothetical protein
LALPPPCRFLWGIAALPLGVYVIAQDLNVPLIVQPQLFGLFSLLCWSQCLYYSATAARSRSWCAMVLAGTLAAWGTLEGVLVLVLRVRVKLLFVCVLRADEAGALPLWHVALV